VTVVFDSDIIGTGEADFGVGARVNFALAHIITRGPRVQKHQVDDGAVQAGWFSFGNTSSVIDDTARTYWTKPIWIDFTNFEWHPVPTTDSAANDFGVWATRVRWYLYEGTTAWLYVYAV
jgi:hypothetical protein